MRAAMAFRTQMRSKHTVLVCCRQIAVGGSPRRALAIADARMLYQCVKRVTKRKRNVLQYIDTYHIANMRTYIPFPI